MRLDLPKQLRSVFVAGALALVLPLAASAQTGGIAGTVTTSATPLSGIVVRIYNASESFVTASAPTSATGAFTVPSLAPGTYYAFAWAGNISGGYVDELYPNTQCIGGPFSGGGNYCRINLGAPIVVTSGGTTTGIDFDLAVGGSISGTVTAAGVAYVSSVELHFDVGGTTSQIGVITSTNAAGAYQLTRLPAGNYYIWAGNVTGGAATGYVSEMFNDLTCLKYAGGVPVTGAGCSLANATPVVVSSAATTPADLDLALGGAIFGSILGSGLPREGSTVSTPGVGFIAVSATVSSVTGAYVLRGMPAGVLSLTGAGIGYASQTLPATVSPGAFSAGPAFDLTLGLPGIRFFPVSRSVISGQSTTLSVSAVGQAPLSYQWYLGQWGDTSNPIVGATSSDYTTPPVTAPASYWVRVSNALGSGGSGLSAQVSVAQAGTGAISGTITSGPNPVANAWVSIFSATEQFMTSAPFTSATGAFSVAGLAPGTYYAFASYNSGVSGNVTGSIAAPPEFPYTDMLYPNIPCAGAHNTGTYCRINTGTPITVTANTITSGIDFDLPVGGRITGALTIGGQIPGQSAFPQVSVIVDAPGPPKLAATGHVDPLGTLVLPRLPAGSYRVMASANGMTSKVWDDVACPAFNCLAAGGIPIVVTAGGTVTGKNFDLVTAPPPPLIVTQPQPQSIAAGQSATLGVTAGGSGPFFYQWYRGFSGNTSAPITGANGSTYATGPLGRGAHEFWVRVSNYGGFIDSATVEVAVNLGAYRR